MLPGSAEEVCVPVGVPVGLPMSAPVGASVGALVGALKGISVSAPAGASNTARAGAWSPLGCRPRVPSARRPAVSCLFSSCCLLGVCSYVLFDAFALSAVCCVCCLCCLHQQLDQADADLPLCGDRIWRRRGVPPASRELRV